MTLDPPYEDEDQDQPARHIRTGRLGDRVALCGVVTERRDWTFADVTHAMLTISGGSCIVPCERCVATAVALLREEGSLPRPPPGSEPDAVPAAHRARVANAVLGLGLSDDDLATVNIEGAELRGFVESAPDDTFFDAEVDDGRLWFEMGPNDLKVASGDLPALRADERAALWNACHASAPPGMECADCSMDRYPCPACLAAALSQKAVRE